MLDRSLTKAVSLSRGEGGPLQGHAGGGGKWRGGVPQGRCWVLRSPLPEGLLRWGRWLSHNVLGPAPTAPPSVRVLGQEPDLTAARVQLCSPETQCAHLNVGDSVSIPRS